MVGSRGAGTVVEGDIDLQRLLVGSLGLGESSLLLCENAELVVSGRGAAAVAGGKLDLQRLIVSDLGLIEAALLLCDRAELMDKARAKQGCLARIGAVEPIEDDQRPLVAYLCTVELMQLQLALCNIVDHTDKLDAATAGQRPMRQLLEPGQHQRAQFKATAMVVQPVEMGRES
jgi:hypothetical protein